MGWLYRRGASGYDRLLPGRTARFDQGINIVLKPACGTTAFHPLSLRKNSGLAEAVQRRPATPQPQQHLIPSEDAR